VRLNIQNELNDKSSFENEELAYLNVLAAQFVFVIVIDFYSL
jgi:hypothetical protein